MPTLTSFRVAARNPRSLAFARDDNQSAAKRPREPSPLTTPLARAPLLLLRFDVGFFYDLSPLCRFSHNVGAELDGGHYVHFRALVPEHLLCFRRAQDSQDFLVQPVSDRARRACRRKDSPPVVRFVAGYAGLGDRRYIGQRDTTLRSTGAQRLNLAGLDMGHKLNQRA